LYITHSKCKNKQIQWRFLRVFGIVAMVKKRWGKPHPTNNTVKSVKSVVNKGFVYLVGAGPGRADLITVRGAQILQKADCIIYDKLANPALLKYARKDAEIISVPKRIGKGSVSQDQINKLLLEKASSGKTVVRLKGGDPGIFGRCAEELAALSDAGIDFEIVPGVTAAIAAAEYAGILLTDRQYSSQVVFVTGQEAKGKEESSIDWQWLAKFKGTIVFYMAMGNLDFIAKQLIKNGLDENTPAAVIADATFPTQKVVKVSLRLISKKCKEEKIEPPAIVVIGRATDNDARLDWFRKKPLFGKNIVVTRDERGNAEFADKIISRGGNPIEFTTIKIKPLTNTNKFLKAIVKLTEFDWIIFTSSNGVEIFFDFLRSLGKDARVFGSSKIAVIGSETAETLSRFGIKAEFVPTVFTSKELGKQLAEFANLHSKKVFLLRSQIASDELIEWLENAGAKIENVPVYRIETAKGKCEPLIKNIKAGEIDWLVFASSSSVRVFFEQIQVKIVNTSKTKVASIGPVTSEQLKSLGIKVNIEVSEHTIDGLLDAIEQTYK
jgi:uroporphyrinogen III methyltransferase/synthase